MTEIIEKLKNTRRGAMFIISAPSGTGKSSVIKKLMEADKNLKFSVSVTTRKPRNGEVNGVDYFYISDEQYQKYLQEDAFYECVNSNYGSKYGTLRSEVDSFLNVGQDVIFDLDHFGLRQMKEKAPDEVVSIYILPPSIKEVRQRLINRGTDSMETINKRMGLIVKTLENWKEYDYVIVNDNLDETVETVQEIISGERIKRVRQAGLKDLVDNLISEANEANNE